MPAPSRPDPVEYFETSVPAVEVAEALLGRRLEDRRSAAQALAALAADPTGLRELLAGVPGGALAALAVIASSDVPLSEAEATRRAELELGEGRGRKAFQALVGRGFLGMTRDALPRYAVWGPLAAPIVEAIAGADVIAAPDDRTATPDRGALAIALLLGHLSRRRPKLTIDGDLFKRDAEEADRIFGTALGPRVAALFVQAFRALGLLADEAPLLDGFARSGARLIPWGDAAGFFAQPRPARVRALAETRTLPRWLGAAFRAGSGLVPRDALRRSARADHPWGGRDDSEADAWIGFCVAAGILDELPGGLRASPTLRGERAPEPPAGGRWLVQPNLEVVVPPEVPPADAFALARAAEIVSLDRAAVLRFTPASLAQAAEAGLDGRAALELLERRSAAPVPELVRRSVLEGARARASATVHEGVVVVVPGEARERVTGRAARLIRAELAPGVFLLEDGAETKFRKVLATLEISMRSEQVSRHASTDQVGRRYGAEALDALLALRPTAPADPRIAAALARARLGEPGEFAPTARPVVNPPEARRADVHDLLDELVGRMEAGTRVSLERLPALSRASFASQLERVLSGLVEPERLGQSFVRSLERVLGPGEPAAPPAPASAPPPVDTPVLDADWERVAMEAIEGRRDLWIRLVDERRPRIVTPHRVARRGATAELLALAHDSGDLRAFPGARILGATAAGPSDPERLPGANAPRAALRASRNDHCPCGSGRKYKACCLPTDLASGGG